MILASLWSKDPLNEYEREAFTLFEQMRYRLRELDVQRLCYLHIDMEHVNRQSVMIANKEMHASREDPAFKKDNAG